MKNLLIIVSLSIHSSILLGQTIHVQQLDENFDVKTMSGSSKAKTRTLKELEASQEVSKELPSNEEVIKTLSQAGLQEEIKNMDALERDQLYRRATYFNAEKLFGYYPKISKKHLKKLHEMIFTQNGDSKK